MRTMVVIALLLVVAAAGCILSGSHQTASSQPQANQIGQNQSTPDMGSMDMNISDNLSEMDDIPDFQLDI